MSHNNYNKDLPTSPPPYSLLPNTNFQRDEHLGVINLAANIKLEDELNKKAILPQNWAPPNPSLVNANYGSTAYSLMEREPDSIQKVNVKVVFAGCGACRVGYVENKFTIFGILCAIFLFPLGLICCYATRQRKCANCGKKPPFNNYV